MKKLTVYVIIALIVVAVAVLYFLGVVSYTPEVDVPDAPGTQESTDTQTENIKNNSINDLNKLPPSDANGIVANNLEIPWDLAFLPDGKILVTERPGNLILINNDGTHGEINIPKVVSRGEGGLLGVTLHPEFENNNWLYLYMSVGESVLGTKNAVIRYEFNNGSLINEKIIIDDIPGAIYHDGGRMEFGPDGLLYITTGDATDADIAQDINSSGGKVLRLNDDGTIPSGNPFDSPVYSYGHRNPQGLAWDDQNRLWLTEHGRSGLTSGLDEVNLIKTGGNYGWPVIEGDETETGMTEPVAHSGPSVTWAPASAVFWNGSIFFGGLKGEALYEAVLDGDQILEVKTYLKGQYGRIRTVEIGPDNMFYLTTSNKDNRGSVRDGDDKIIRLNPVELN